jgi:hypothetical protein
VKITALSQMPACEQLAIGLPVGSGEIIFLSFDGNQNYYTDSFTLLIRTNCVVIFVAIK